MMVTNRSSPARWRALVLFAVVLAAALVLASCGGGASGKQPRVGDPAPGFSTRDATGAAISLDTLLARNNGVVLVFYRGVF
jgi:hypothetical protein